MNRIIAFIFINICLALLSPANAHEVRPGFLKIDSLNNNQYKVLWKVPSKGNVPLPISPRFEEGCNELTPPSSHFVQSDASLITHWTMECANGIDGVKIHIDGLEATVVDVLVNIQLQNDKRLSHILKPNSTSFVVNVSGSSVPIMDYISLGVEHILMGIDHLLFVLCLILLVRGNLLLIKTITAFTVAHSITLAAATLEIINVPQSPVEAVIALSIVFLAYELVKYKEIKITLTQLYPWLVAFIFGLLHGLGFAGALRNVGLPQDDIPLALLLFNVGVEIGQLLFVAAVIILAWAARRIIPAIPTWAPRTLAYAIGCISAYWFIERIVDVV